MYFLYQIIISFLLIFSPVIIIYRLLKNKEDKKRFVEKFGISSKKREKGKLIWFHGASVGEILSIIPIIKNYEKKKIITGENAVIMKIIMWYKNNIIISESAFHKNFYKFLIFL